MSQSYQDARRLLTPEVKEALDAYIGERRGSSFKFGLGTILTVIVALAGFLAFAFDSMQKTARVSAINEVRQASVQKVVLQQAQDIQSTFQKTVADATQAQILVQEANEAVEAALKDWESRLIEGQEQFSALQNSIEEESDRAIRNATLAARRATDTQEKADLANSEATRALQDSQNARKSSEKLVKESTQLAREFKALSDEFGGIQNIMDAVRKSTKKSPALEVLMPVINDKLAAIEIPTGAVLAMDLRSGCPPGWSEFDDAAGRTIVGVGSGDRLTTRQFRDVRGSESQILSVEQMPNHIHDVSDPGHSHDLYQSPSSGPSIQSGLAIIGGHKNVTPFRNAQVDVSVTGISVKASGENREFGIMPPFIALFLCKKLDVDWRTAVSTP